MNADPVSETHQIRRTAADWLARRHGGFGAGEEFAFARWLAADPRHRAAFDQTESAWSVVNAPHATGNSEALRRGLAAQTQRRARRRRSFVLGSVGFAAAALLFAFLLPSKNPVVPNQPVTVALRPDKRVLPDGSTVELNAGAEIAIEFFPERRSVRLVRGEALFEVTKDMTRPFVVSAGAVEVKAVGTAFSVRFAPEQVDVFVTEGRVAVNRIATSPPGESAPTPEPVYLDAGGRLALPAAQPTIEMPKPLPVSSTEIMAALAWRGKRVEFTDTPLAEAVALFNRQNKIQLSVANRANDSRCINGIFWADDAPGFARLLETTLGLTIVREGEVIVLRDR